MRQARVLVSLSIILGGGGVASATTPNSGIAGRIVEAPTCPVESVPPSPQCAPRPLAASVRIRRVGSHGRWTLVHSRSDGRFRIRLAGATYVVQPLPRSGSPFPRPPAPSHVRVRTGRFTTVTITYDTGIR